MRNYVLPVLSIGLLIGASAANAAALPEGYSGDITVGYVWESGNTDKTATDVTIHGEKQFDGYRLQLQGDIHSASTESVQDTENYAATAKWDIELGEDKRLFNQYQVGWEKDRFSGVDRRLRAAVGLGYWITREEDRKFEVDASIGYETTKYYPVPPASSNTEDGMIAIGHLFYLTPITDTLKFSEDITVTPALYSGGGTKFVSVSELTNALSDNLALSVKYIYDYDDSVASGSDVVDQKAITGIKYTF